MARVLEHSTSLIKTPFTLRLASATSSNVSGFRNGEEGKKLDVVPDDEPEPHLLSVDDVDDKIDVLRRGAPPLALSFEDFRDNFGLNGTGINLHKSTDTIEILQSALTSVFGPRRAKSGF